MRKIKVVNTLTGHRNIINVCNEETINEIMDRYKEYNDHAESYTWKRLKRVLEMEETLDQNGIPEEFEEYFAIPGKEPKLDNFLDEEDEEEEDFNIPVIHLYFNDDLTEA